MLLRMMHCEDLPLLERLSDVLPVDLLKLNHVTEELEECAMTRVQFLPLLHPSEESVEFDQAFHLLTLLAHLYHAVVHAHSELFFFGGLAF